MRAMAGKKSRRYSKCCRGDFERMRLRFHPPWKLCANKIRYSTRFRKPNLSLGAWAALFLNAGMLWLNLEPERRCQSLVRVAGIDSPRHESITALTVSVTLTSALLQMGESIVCVLHVFLYKGTLRSISDWKAQRVGIVAGLYKIIPDPLLNLLRRY